MEIEENVCLYIVSLVYWQQNFEVDSNSVHAIFIELFDCVGKIDFILYLKGLNNGNL